MIYLDSSVLLADLFVEPRSPPEAFWAGILGSSRLLVYEVWSRINARGLSSSHGARAQGLLERVSFTDMSELALARALNPFPVSIRTLDGMHLATMDFLRRQGEPVELASYDNRMIVAAQAMGIGLTAL